MRHGADHIDPSGRPDAKGSVFDPGLVYDADLLDYVAFLCGADTSVFVDPASTCGQFENASMSTSPADLNLASIGASAIAGSVTVQRTVTSVADSRRVFRAQVEAPGGFDVVVTPDMLRLAPGESAVVDITITNASAPVDTWAFGSLTWRSGTYEVRSPIALNAGGVPVTTTALRSVRCSRSAITWRYSECIVPVQALCRWGRRSQTVATRSSIDQRTAVSSPLAGAPMSLNPTSPSARRRPARADTR